MTAFGVDHGDQTPGPANAVTYLYNGENLQITYCPNDTVPANCTNDTNYHETLKASPEARRYLESRGLTHPEMIAHCKLGFANRTLGYRLPEKNRKAGAEMRGRLQKLGILRESGHEHFNGSVIVPIFDLAGNVLGLYGRKITPRLREGTPLHRYLPGPHRGVWNEEALMSVLISRG